MLPLSPATQVLSASGFCTGCFFLTEENVPRGSGPHLCLLLSPSGSVSEPAWNKVGEKDGVGRGGMEEKNTVGDLLPGREPFHFCPKLDFMFRPQV